MKRDEIKLRIVKKAVPPIPKQPPPPVMPKPRGHQPLKPSPLTLPVGRLDMSDSMSPTGPDGTSTPAQNSRFVSTPVNAVNFAGGKFCENDGKTFHVGVIFTKLLLFPS